MGLNKPVSSQCKQPLLSAWASLAVQGGPRRAPTPQPSTVSTTWPSYQTTPPSGALPPGVVWGCPGIDLRNGARFQAGTIALNKIGRMPHHIPAPGCYTACSMGVIQPIWKRDNHGAGRCLALMLLLTQVAGAQSLDTASQLLQIKQSIITVHDLEQHGLMTPSEVDKAIAFSVAQASQLAGHLMSVQQILAVPELSEPSLTPLQAFAGAITFLNVILVFAIIAVGGAFIYLFKHYMRILSGLLVHVSVLVYELLFYAASLSSALIGWWLPALMHQSLALPTCVLFAGALAFSVSYRRELAQYFYHCEVPSPGLGPSDYALYESSGRLFCRCCAAGCPRLERCSALDH